MTEQKNLCKVCGKKEVLLKDVKDASKTEQKLFRCSRCLETLYCSRECQRSDWPEHKEICVKKVSQFSEHEVQKLRETLLKSLQNTDEKPMAENKVPSLPIEEEEYFRKCLTAMGRKHIDAIFKIGEDRKESICSFLGKAPDVSEFTGSELASSNLSLALELGHNPFNTTEILDIKNETYKGFADYIKVHVPALPDYSTDKRYCVYVIVDDATQCLYLPIICKSGKNYSVTLTKNKLMPA